MQPSIRNTTEVSFAAEPGVKGCFDAYVEGNCSYDEFLQQLRNLCRADAEAVWEVLALLDQYDRKGQLPAAEFASFKNELEQGACGYPAPQGGLRDDRDPTSEVPAVSTPAQKEPRLRSSPARVKGGARPLRLHKTPDRTEIAGADREEQIVSGSRSEFTVGTVLRNRFVLEGVLGTGGMGTVFRALDRNRSGMPEGDRRVAIKVMRPELEIRPEAIDILMREFTQAQRLSHPGIVKVFDFDCDNGRHFMTMELLRGRTLDEVLESRGDRGPLEPHSALTILRQLGAAIAYAHKRGVVHADLKPGNVMLTEDGQARVLDFGMAYPLLKEPWISDAPALFLAVTRNYASCERLEGRTPDERDDIFSFACICYEVLTGLHPFGRRSALEARASRLRPRRRPGISRQQWRGLRSGLALDRQTRPASIQGFLDQLRLQESRAAATTAQIAGRTPETTSRVTWMAAALACVAIGGAWILASKSQAWPLAAASVMVTLERSTNTARDWFTAKTDQLALLRRQGRRGEADAQAPVANAAPVDFALGETQIPLSQVPQPSSSDVLPAQAPSQPPVKESFLPLPQAPVRVPSSPGILGFAQDSYSVSEAMNAARLLVRRSAGTEGAISFRWRTIDNDARAGADYASFGTVSEIMGAGQESIAITVPLVMDGIREESEAFTVEILLPAGGAVLGKVTRTAVIIVDDD